MALLADDLRGKDGWMERGKQRKEKKWGQKEWGTVKVMFVIAEVMYELVEVKRTGFPEMLSN